MLLFLLPAFLFPTFPFPHSEVIVVFNNMIFFLIYSTTAFSRNVVKCINTFPIICSDSLDFISKLIWSFIIFSFVKCYTVLSPSAFNLWGFITVSTLAEFVGIRFSTGENYSIGACVCIRRCRHAGQGDAHAEGIGNTPDLLFQCQTSKEKTSQACTCRHVAIRSDIPLRRSHRADPDSRQPGCA